MKAAIFTFICLLSFAAQGQQPYFINIDDSKGLPSNNVYSILQDKKGYIWVATQEGISRYDGFSFKTYNNLKQTSASGSNLKEDNLGRIWYQNFDGYCYYIENDSLHQLNQNKPLGFFAFGITNKYLFLLQARGVDVYDINTLQHLKTVIFIKNTQFINNTATFNNQFYFTANSILYEVSANLNLRATQVQIVPNEKNNQLYNSNSSLIISARENENNRLCFYKNGNIIGKKQIIGPELIHNVAQIGNEYWVLSPDGAYVYSTKGVQHFFEKQSLSCVIKDKDNNYWVTSTSRGIFLIPSLQTTFTTIENYKATVFEKTPNGFLLFTQNNEIVALNNNFKPTKKLHTSPINAPIYYTYFDSSLNLLFTSSLGVNVFKTQPFKFLMSKEYALKSIAKIDHKYYVQATSGHANLAIWPNANLNIPSKWDEFYQQLGKKNEAENRVFIRDIRAKTVAYNALNNDIYCGSNIGLYKQSLSQLTEMKQNGLSIFITKIIAINANLFALTTKGELLKITNDSVFENINNLSNIQIKEVKKIKAYGNRLCILGYNTFVIIDTEKPAETIYRLAVPLKTSEINDFILAQNNLHILTYNNIISTSIISKLPNKVIPNFAINNFEINGNSYLHITKPLSYQENNIIINYALLNYAQSGNQNIAYKINNENWINTLPNMRSLQFAALSPGNYHIQFKVNDTLIPNSNLHFFIKKPFWLQWWFLAIAAFLIVITGLSYYKWQMDLLIKKNRLTTDKIALENELNKSKLTYIKSQMNPHFFYNALNTIQSYIFTNDKKNASNYLAKFSKLTRMILEMSEKDTISIGEEIEALNLYLALEQMRFDDDFIFTLQISTEIDREMHKIPPMLLQPYIENAIKHGLLHKEGFKTLRILFDSQDNNLLITINDNGVGRKRSEQLNKIRENKHQSFSTNANKKRLEILNHNKNKLVAVVILDNYNEIGNAIGTTVKLSIPLT